MGQTPAIFKEMYEHVAATTDTPSYLFWEQILEVFPDAKVILVERDEDKWAKSLESHFVKERKQNLGGWLLMYCPRFLFQLLQYPLWQGQTRHRDLSWGMAVGPMSAYGPNRVNMMIARKRYREHNAYVKLKCPPEKLLVYKLQDGWKPLCDFVGKNVPNTEFPQANKGGTIIDDALEYPTVKQQVRGLIINTILFSIFLLGFFAFFIYT